MTDEHLREARTTVERAEQRSEQEKREQTAGSAKREAIKRVASAPRRGLRRFLFENGLVLTATLLFLLAFVGQILAGRANYNEDQREHGQEPVALGEYLRTGAFVEATAENLESEFLQMGVFVVLTVFLYQRGSSESKKLDQPEAVDQRPEEARYDPDAPWPVRYGGVPLALYKHSLSLVLFTLFLVSFAVHAAGGAADYSEEQLAHGGQAVSAVGYLSTSRFWFESFQNWQSEFLSVAVLVLLSIWLREQGSPQSKPVAASASDTGE
ncbi:MAG: DUF6766 family protein [Gemmatimonadaceae bacterium]